MKFKAAEKDENIIINSEEYRRLHIIPSNGVQPYEPDTMKGLVCESFIPMSPQYTLSSTRKKSSPSNSMTNIAKKEKPQIITNAGTEDQLVLKISTKRVLSMSPKPTPTNNKKKCSPLNVVDMSKIDGLMETRLSLETISQFLDKIPEALRDVPISTLDGDGSVSPIVRSMSYADIAQHLRSLRTEYVMRLARPIVTRLMQHPKNMKLFNKPVNTALIPTYESVIKSPIDLGTILGRLQMGCHFYDSVESCFRDILRVFENAILFNPSNHIVHKLAVELKKELFTDMQNCLDRCLKEIERKKQHSCSFCCGCECHLCGEKCLKFEPTVQICHGSCGQRIKRNSLYYLSVDCSYLWCYKCYNNLPAVVVEYPPVLDPTTGVSTTPTPLLKKNLIRRKSDEEVAEAWVECDTCGYWVHQVCALYDGFDSRGTAGQFQCPLCTLQRHKGIVDTSRSMNIVGDSESDVSASADVDRKAKRKLSIQNFQRFKCIPNVEVDTPELKMKLVLDELKSCASVVNTVHINLEACPPRKSLKESACRSNLEDDSGKEADAISNLSDGSHGDLSIATSSVKPRYRSPKALKKLVINCAAECDTTAESRFCDGENDEPPNLAQDDLSIGSGPQSSSEQDMSTWRAASLPRTKLSDFLEEAVKGMLEEMGFGDISSTITIRLCSNRDHKMEVPRAIVENMVTVNGNRVPDHLAYRQKCILLFQKIDGIDVCLFCLYVQEFDDSCPPPNTSTVYIAYLDSVNYFRPAEARTKVYQEVVIGYLQWAQARGFKQGHIWSCPPQRGDNFIFNSHPSHQKTPSRERLNSWYNSILIRASQLGILSEIGTLGDKYFAKYSKREENPPRQAAKNSLVSAMKLASQTKLRSKNIDRRKIWRRQLNLTGKSDGNCDVMPLETVASAVQDLQQSADESTGSAREEVVIYCPGPENSAEAVMQIPETDEVALEENTSLPICPPIFEGDLWVMEWVKVSRNAIRSRGGGDGKDKSINQRRCRDLMRLVMSRNIALPFNQPVDVEALNIPNYRSIISNPMDLGTIRGKLRDGIYSTMMEFYADVELTFNNAMIFNPKGHYIHTNAALLLSDIQKALVNIVVDFTEEAVDIPSLPRVLSQFPLGLTDGLSPRDRSNSVVSLELKTEQDFSCSRNQSGVSLSSLASEPFLARSVEERGDGFPSVPYEQPSICDLVASPVSTRIPPLEGLLSPEPEEMSLSSTEGRSGRTVRKRKAVRLVGDESPSGPSNTSTRAQNLPDGCGSDYFDFQLARAGSTPMQGSMLCRSVSVDSYYRTNEDKCDDTLVTEGQEARQRHDFMVSQAQVAMSDEDVQESYRFSAREFNKQYVPVRPGKPSAGLKAIQTMTQELSKCIQRLNDDLFVFKFAPFAEAKVLAEDSVPEDEGAVHTDSGSFMRGKLHKGRAQAYLKKIQQLTSKISMSNSDSTDALEGEASPRATLVLSSPRGQMLQHRLDSRSSDPDCDNIISPLVDSRHSFLEMSQFRHYQFDSLRRAQHSSLMILYHLHHPFDPKTRPTCFYCENPIRNLRWHCDQCSNFECCQSCYEIRAGSTSEETLSEEGKKIEACEEGAMPSTKRVRKEGDVLSNSAAVSFLKLPAHEHPLTPFRVSYF